MIVHIVRSEEVSKSMVKTIAEIINKPEGPVEFIFQPDDLQDEDEDTQKKQYDKAKGENENPDKPGFISKVLPWSILFGYCYQYRAEKNITDEETV